MKNSTAIAQMIMELSEKTINFEEEELFLDVMMEFQELGLAIQQFIDQYDYRIVASRSTSRLVTCLGIFRLLMKGIFGPYVL